MLEENNLVPESSSTQNEGRPEQPAQTTNVQSSQEKNLGAMRKKLEAEEEARKAAERRAYDLEQKMQNYSANQPQTSPQDNSTDEEIGVDNEDYVQAKHIKTSHKKLNSKLSATDKRIAELEQKLSYFEAKVDTDSLKDFNEVVSDENLRTFARLYPDDYQSMMSNPNLKAKSKTAYNMIKNYGIVDRNNEESNQKIESNNKKPKLASLGSPQSPATPLTRLGDYERRVLSEADKDRILARVEQVKRGG